MRKTVDTLLLILLLIGPAVILTCVRQPGKEKKAETNETTALNNTNDSVDVYAAVRP